MIFIKRYFTRLTLRMSKIMIKNNWMMVAAVFMSLTIIYFLYTTSGNWESHKMSVEQEDKPVFAKQPIISDDYEMWPPFQAPKNDKADHAWFQESCLPSVGEITIANLSKVLSHWANVPNQECRDMFAKFNALYSVSTRNASLVLPKPFQAKVKHWLGDDENLFRDVYNQQVVHVVNRYMREHTIFNPLRDKRPVLPPDEPEREYFRNILRKTARTCDFCRFRNYTAEHTFLRIENEFAFSASNTFKMDTLHALIGMKQHDPIHWRPSFFTGMMQLAVDWFNKAHQSFPEARFPSMIWDVLPKCGASQVHPHLQAFLDPERYHGVVEAWRRGAQDYYNKHETNIFTDMAKVAAALGLATTHRTAVAFANLAPRKDNEVIIMAPAADKDFFEMLYFVVRGFIDDLDKYCFSMGMSFPQLAGMEGVMPAFARIITRGVVTDIRSDISSLELFTATNVNIDPFKVAFMIRESARHRVSIFKIKTKVD